MPTPRPNSNVCMDQQTFNMAFSEAVDNYNEGNELTEEEKKNYKNARLIAGAIMITFFVWAVCLASKMEGNSNKVLNMFLAIVASPVYVIAHYFSVAFKKE